MKEPTSTEMCDALDSALIREKIHLSDIARLEGELLELKRAAYTKVQDLYSLIAEFIDHFEAISWTKADRVLLIQRAKEAVRPN